MLAIFGLLSLAFAGTAFVISPSDTETASDGAETPDADESFETVSIETVINATDDIDNDTSDSLIAETGDGYDEFYGGDGNDIADGQGSHDYLNGRSGNDTLSGGDGDDHLHGGEDDDVLSGDEGDDLVYGYVGDDDMSGGAGDDEMTGGDGNDHIYGGDGNDELLGGHGADTLIGGAGRDMIQGSEGDDVIDGVTGETTAERDYLNGSEGQDRLIGNDGDVMSGGADSDQFEITSGTVSIMDYTDEDVLILNYEDDAPDLTTQTTDNGIMLLANGTPVAALYGLTSFDVSTVQLVRT